MRIAVKTLAETLLTSPADACAAMTTRRFDGHKGVALRFDGVSGGLIQPAYLVRDEQGNRVVTEVR